MKVLIYRYGSICEPDIIATFKKMDFDVIEYDREITHKKDEPSLSVKLLSDFLQDHEADFVFSINFFPYVSEVCRIYHLRYLSWIVDAPVMELYSKSITNECNRVFLFDRALYNDIHPFNEKCVFHLPLAARTEDSDHLIESASRADIDRFSHEVAFVGSLYSEKCPYDRAKKIPEETAGYLQGIMEAQVRVYGYYFIEDLISDKIVEDFKSGIEGFYTYPAESFLTDKRTLSQLYIGNKVTAMERDLTFRTLSENFNTSIYTASDTSAYPHIHNMGLAKTLTEMPLIFHYSKININTTSKPIRTGLPLRIFDILSCGGFCLSNYQEEIPELLVPDEDIVMYGSMEELVDKCAYYLEHDDLRREIAINGYRKLKENYSYEKQLEKLLLTAYSF